MHRIDTADAVDGKFSEGSTAGQQATAVSAPWLNAVQEELCAVIEHFAVDLDKATNNQLLTVLLSAIAGAASPVTKKSAPEAQTYTGRSGSGMQTKLYSFAHDLGVRPEWITLTVECIAADGGFTVGDFVPLPVSQATRSNDNAGNVGYVIKMTDTDIQLSVDGNHGMQLHEWQGDGNFLLANNKWKLHVIAYA